MSGTIQYEVRLLMMSFLTGAGLIMVYDCLRVFRILCPHSAVFTGIEDMLYWVYSALITFTLLYRENDGDIRAYVIAAAFLGMAMYQYLVSRNFLKGLKNLIKYLRIKTGRHNISKSRWKHERDEKIKKKEKR